MKSFIVIGLGRFGEAAARKLCDLGREVLAIDKDEASIQSVADIVTHAIIADASDEKTLRAIEAHSYDCAIVAVGDNLTDSVLISLALKELGVKKIICKARDFRHKKILLKLGVCQVIIPEHEAGSRLAVHVAELNLVDSLKLSDTFGVSALIVPRRWEGKTIEELNIRGKYGCFVAAVQRAEDTKDRVTIAPKAEYAFAPGDLLVLVGENTQFEMLSRL